jgi:hypothetical protein
VLAWIGEVWTAYAHRAATYQTRVLLNVVYAVVLGPAALLGRLFGARLMDLTPPSPSAPSTLLVRPTSDTTLEALRRQF